MKSRPSEGLATSQLASCLDAPLDLTMAFFLVLVQIAMVLAILLHPRVLGGLLNLFLGLKGVQVEVKGVHIFSLRLSRVRVRLRGSQPGTVSIAWLGLMFKGFLGRSPFVVWVDSMTVELDQPEHFAPKEESGEVKSPLSRVSHKEGFVLPSGVALLARLGRLHVSNLLFKAKEKNEGICEAHVGFVELSGHYQTDMPSQFQRLSVALYLKGINGETSGERDSKLPRGGESVVDMLRSITLSDFKLGLDLEINDRDPNGLRLISVSSLLCTCGHIISSLAIPREPHEHDSNSTEEKSSHPDSTGIAPGATTSGQSAGTRRGGVDETITSHRAHQRPSLALFDLLPSAATFSAASVRVTLESSAVSGEEIPCDDDTLLLSIRSSGPGDSPVVGENSLSVKWLLGGVIDVDPLLASSTPTLSVGVYMAALNFSIMGRDLSFSGLRLKPDFSIEKVAWVKSGRQRTNWAASISKNQCTIERISGHVGSPLAAWISFLNTRETRLRRRAGRIRHALLEAGNEVPAAPPKPDVEMLVDFINISIEQPRAAGKLACQDGTDVCDAVYTLQANCVEVLQSVHPEKEDRCKDITLEAKLKWFSIEAEQQESAHVGVLKTSYLVATSIEMNDMLVSKRAKRSLRGDLLEAHMDAKVAKATAVQRTKKLGTSEIFEIKGLHHRQEKVNIACGPDKLEAESTTRTEIDSLRMSWSGSTHVALMRLASRLPASIDMILGEYSTLRPRKMERVVSIPSCLLFVHSGGNAPPFRVKMWNLITKQSKMRGVVSEADHYSGLEFKAESFQADLPSWACRQESSDDAHSRQSIENSHDGRVGGEHPPLVPFLISSNLQIIMTKAGTSPGNCKKAMAVNANSVHITLPPYVELGNLRQMVMRQYHLTEIELGEKEVYKPTSHAFELELGELTLLCKHRGDEQTGLGLEMRLRRRDADSLECSERDFNASTKSLGVWMPSERKLSRGWGASSEYGLVSDGALAMTLMNLSYKVSRNETSEDTCARLRSLDEDPIAHTLHYTSIMGGNAEIYFADMDLWAAGCEIPMLSVKRWEGSGDLFQAALKDEKCLRKVGMPLSHSHPKTQLHQKDVALQLDSSPAKLYTSMQCAISGLSVVLGSCLDIPLQLMTTAAMRLMPQSDSESISPPTGLWDKFRNLIHGELTFSFSSMSYTHLVGSSGTLEQLPQCLICMIQEADVSYSVGKFDCDLRHCVVSTPDQPMDGLTLGASETVNRSMTRTLASRKLTHLSSTSTSGGLFWNYMPNLDADLIREQELEIHGPRHYVLFVPSTRLVATLKWECSSGQALHHHSRDVASFTASGLRLGISMKTSVEVGTEQTLWGALRLDLIEWLMPGRYYAGLEKHQTEIGGSTAGQIGEAEQGSEVMSWGDLFACVDFELSLESASAAVWRGEGARSSGFVLSVGAVNARSLPPSEGNGRDDGTFEFLLRNAQLNLLDMDDVVNRWRSIIDQHARDREPLTREAKAWVIVTALHEATEAERLLKGEESCAETYTMGAECVAFRSGRSLLESLESVEKNHHSLDRGKFDGSEDVSFSHFFQTHLRPRDGSCLPSSPPTSDVTHGFQKQSPIAPVQARKYTDPDTAFSSWDEGLESDAKIRGFSALANRVVVVESLKLLWTIPIRDAVVLLVADLLQHLAPADRPLAEEDPRESKSSPLDCSAWMENSEAPPTHHPSDSSAGAAMADLSPANLNLLAMKASPPLSPSEPEEECKGSLLDWLAARGMDKSNGNLFFSGDPTGDMGGHSSGSSKIPSPEKGNRISRRVAHLKSGLSGLRKNKRAPVGSSETDEKPKSPDDGKPKSQSKNSAISLAPLRDFLVDYQVCLLEPQVKLRSVKGSLVLSIKDASVLARTFRTVYLRSSLSAAPGSPIPLTAGAKESPGSASRICSDTCVRRKDVRVILSEARAYSLPTDIDFTGGARWVASVKSLPGPKFRFHSQGSVNSELFGGEEVLREVMAPFEITTNYQFYEAVSQAELARIVSQSSAKITHLGSGVPKSVTLNVPELTLNVDSEQFYQVLDVVRHLLLAPPPQERLEAMQSLRNTRRRSSYLDATSSFNENDGINRGVGGRKAGYDVGMKADRDLLKTVVEEALEMGSKIIGMVSREVSSISYSIGRCTWRLMMSPQLMESEGITDRIEVGFTGFSARHSYMMVLRPSEQPIVYQDVLMQVERLWVSNLCPGPDALSVFADATQILSVILADRAPCQRCGDFYDPEDNRQDSCSSHCHSDGSAGEYTVRDGRREWSCCGSPMEDAPGCTRHPHVAKEVMLTLRAQGGTPVLAGSTTVSVFKHVEVNMFPSASYTLVLQLTRGVAALLQRYFNIEEPQEVSKEGGAAALLGSGVTSPAASAGRDPGHRLDTSQHSGPNPASLLLGGKRKSSHVDGLKKSEDERDTEKTASSPQEALYLKYFRLGDVNLKVSVNGFKLLRLDGYSVEVKAFTRWSKVVSWQRLAWKLVWHITMNVTKKAFKPSVNIFRSSPQESAASPSSFLKTLGDKRQR